MAETLKDKIVWVTGAGTGIGRAGAEEIARAGARVILSGRRREPLEEVRKTIDGEGGIAEIELLDVADEAAVNSTAKAVLSRHGRVDILINSAGLNVPKRNWPVVDGDAWRHVYDVNVHGTFYCIQAVLPSMRERKDGLVINISSWAGRYSSPLTGPAYTGAKHAVVAMTISLNQEECINGIRATAICPGEVATEIMQKRPVPPSQEDLDRMVQPAEMGKTLRFVAEMPPEVCVNEILISPTWNRGFVAALKNGPR